MPIIDLGNGLKAVVAGPSFPAHTVPNGWLTPEPACQALWNYAMEAIERMKRVGNSIDDQTLLEGTLWLQTYYRQQANTIAKLYGVTLEDMWKHWVNVRMEMESLGWGEPPNEIITMTDRGDT